MGGCHPIGCHPGGDDNPYGGLSPYRVSPYGERITRWECVTLQWVSPYGGVTRCAALSPYRVSPFEEGGTLRGSITLWCVTLWGYHPMGGSRCGAVPLCVVFPLWGRVSPGGSRSRYS